ncbi:TetR/AcrR family transcriptional regulator [Actinomadura logoneensis]|uniref:TetR/AcrR family transcriptional regulator n=1 Tax=Actinomadura logoneensis TaxID=2293572 RepID=A0A372JPU3_9ACTN|nr:TetR/AcrR family transcriptional regulator [Actinomadura logoneensis]RFU41979.1 TetR/AcrR family transcriptional regulator [Actinomadura logoneensis]
MADRPRARQIVDAARELLETEGADALTMRRIADRLGIRAPSLYKHFPDKQAVEAELIAQGLAEMADVQEAALAREAERPLAPEGERPLVALGAAYRAYALAHPHLYRLMTEGPLPRHLLPDGLEQRAALPLVRTVPDEHRARAVWAFAHGMVTLEMDGRFPPGADLDRAWQVGLAALAD